MRWSAWKDGEETMLQRKWNRRSFSIERRTEVIMGSVVKKVSVSI
jgi:hypothetical protein